MKRCALIVAGVLAAALPHAAQAQQKPVQSETFKVRFAPKRDFYFDLRLGVPFLEEADNELARSVGAGSAGQTEFEAGSSISGALGYRFGGRFRADVELSYSDNDFEVFDPFRDRTTAGTAAAPASHFFFGPVFVIDEPNISAFAYTANIYYDFAVPWRVRPYIGIGAGGATIDVDDADLIDDDDTVFVFQSRAGLAIPLQSWAAVSVGYRLMLAGDPKFRNFDSQVFESEYTSHTIEFGLRFAF